MQPIALKRSPLSYVPFGLMAILLLVPVLGSPDTGEGRGMRAFVVELAAFGALAALLARVGWSLSGLRQFFTAAPNLPVILLVGWALLSYILSAPAEGRGLALATVELLRLAAGAAIYFVVAYGFNSRFRLKRAAILLLAGGALAAIMIGVGVSPENVATSAFANKQLHAAFLLLLLPAAVVFAVKGKWLDSWRLMAIVTALMIIAALALTNNRSSWLGSLFGLAIVAGLMIWTRSRKQETEKRRWVVLAIVTLASVVLFFTFLGTGSTFIERAGTLAFASKDASFQWRLRMWSFCELIIRDRPLMGAGIGSFPMAAGDYATQITDAPTIIPDSPRIVLTATDSVTGESRSYSQDIPSTEQVKREGASMSSLPHNEYLQIAAETGLIGLALYLLILIGFFYRGIKFLSRKTGFINRTQKLLLIASIGTIAAQCVDAMSNPGWQFGEVSALFWLMLGLGMAATHAHHRKQQGVEDTEQEDGKPVLQLFGYNLGRLSWQTMCVVFGLTFASITYAEITDGKGTPEANYSVDIDGRSTLYVFCKATKRNSDVLLTATVSPKPVGYTPTYRWFISQNEHTVMFGSAMPYDSMSESFVPTLARYASASQGDVTVSVHVDVPGHPVQLVDIHRLTVRRPEKIVFTNKVPIATTNWKHSYSVSYSIADQLGEVMPPVDASAPFMPNVVGGLPMTLSFPISPPYFCSQRGGNSNVAANGTISHMIEASWLCFQINGNSIIYRQRIEVDCATSDFNVTIDRSPPDLNVTPVSSP